MNELLPAIIVVAYNRCKSLERLLQSISKAKFPSKDIVLIISIDYSSSNQDVITLAENFSWNYGNKIVQKHDSNLGLRAHVLECGEYSKKYGCIILLEDDLVVAEDFYFYAMSAQKNYFHNDNIAGVALYSYAWNLNCRLPFVPEKCESENYFGQFCVTWGQSWTELQWNNFVEWYEKNKEWKKYDNLPTYINEWPDTSWGRYFAAFIVECNKYYVIPYTSRSTCFSEVGQHTFLKSISQQVVLMEGMPANYSFADFKKGIKYDIFFESINLKKFLFKKLNQDVCIDIYGSRQTVQEQFLLSTKQLPFKRVEEYGAEMTPIEKNIYLEIPGKDIYLYDTKIKARKTMQGISLYDYFLSGYDFASTFLYAIRWLISHGINKIRRLFVKNR